MKKTVNEVEREYVAPAIEELIFKANKPILESPQLPDPDDPEPDE